MKFALFLALFSLLPAAARAETTVETASGDWSYLPMLQSSEYGHLHTGDLDRLWQIGRSNKCKLPGYSGRRLNFQVSFAVQYRPDGTLGRLILPQLNCPAAESLLGAMLTEMVVAGDYRPVPANSDGWYRGDFAFDYTG